MPACKRFFVMNLTLFAGRNPIKDQCGGEALQWNTPGDCVNRELPSVPKARSSVQFLAMPNLAGDQFQLRFSVVEVGNE